MWVGVEFYTILMKWCKNWCGLEMLHKKNGAILSLGHYILQHSIYQVSINHSVKFCNFFLKLYYSGVLYSSSIVNIIYLTQDEDLYKLYKSKNEK